MNEVREEVVAYQSWHPLAQGQVRASLRGALNE